MAHPIFTEEHDLIRSQLRRFVEEKVKPHGPKWEEAGFVPREVLREMGELGFFSLRVPEELGGAGLDARASVVLAEELGRSTHGGFAITVLVHTDMATPHLLRFGSKRQLEKYLPGIMAGTTITAVGVTEPGAGLDTTKITTFARREGDRYLVNGRKVWISKAVESEKILLLTRTTKFEDVTRKTEGLTLFLTDIDRNKVDIKPIAKMGRNAVTSNELFIDGLEIPVDDRVGQEGQGFKYILDGLNPERCLIAAEALGMGRAALRAAHERFFPSWMDGN